MEAVLAVVVGIFFAASIYLILSKYIVRILLGVAILGNAVNLLLFTSGRLTREVPPIIPEGLDALPAGAANPLPQALILTAIVISFSFFAFLLVNLGAYVAFGVGNRLVVRAHNPDSASPGWVDGMLRRLLVSSILVLLLVAVIVWISLGIHVGAVPPA